VGYLGVKDGFEGQEALSSAENHKSQHSELSLLRDRYLSTIQKQIIQNQQYSSEKHVLGPREHPSNALQCQHKNDSPQTEYEHESR
jgi:hypothetical protein